jgi:hypothetical protein
MYNMVQYAVTERIILRWENCMYRINKVEFDKKPLGYYDSSGKLDATVNVIQ